MKDFTIHFLVLLALPLVFVLNLAGQVYPFLSIGSWLVFIVIRISISMGLYALLAFVLKSTTQSCLLVLLLSFIYFGWPSVMGALAHVVTVQYRWTLPVTTLVTSYLVYRIITKPISPKSRKLLFSLPLLMVAVALGQLLFEIILGKGASRVTLQKTSSWQPKLPAFKPDIYFLLVDELAGSDALQHLHQIDNHRLDQALTAIGFQVCSGFQSNYNWTHFSLASVFNGHYLNISAPEELDYTDYMAATGWVIKSQLVDFLRQHQYSVRSYSLFPVNKSLLPDTIRNDYIGIYDPEQFTAWGQWKKDIGWHWRKQGEVDTSALHAVIENRLAYNRWLSTNLHQETGEKNTQPKFVFAHYFIAHHPLLYTGLLRRPAADIAMDESNRTLVKAYAANLPFVRYELLQAVSAIQNGTNHSAIIIVMGDHGLRLPDKPLQPTGSFDAFFAVYLPHSQQKLPDYLHAVNVFRWLFSDYGKNNYQPLPRKTVFLKDKDR